MILTSHFSAAHSFNTFIECLEIIADWHAVVRNKRDWSSVRSLPSADILTTAVECHAQDAGVGVGRWRTFLRPQGPAALTCCHHSVLFLLPRHCPCPTPLCPCWLWTSHRWVFYTWNCTPCNFFETAFLLSGWLWWFIQVVVYVRSCSFYSCVFRGTPNCVSCAMVSLSIHTTGI